jgi:hypothetical protein
MDIKKKLAKRYEKVKPQGELVYKDTTWKNEKRKKKPLLDRFVDRVVLGSQSLKGGH